jgi:hypothetical protein
LHPDSIVPNPANPQSLNRFGYVLNNPINFTDPTGHWGECANDPNCSKVLDTYVKAAIKMESPTIFGNTRPRWLVGGNRFSGIGLAKISDAEMEGEYGKIVDKEHIKVGLGLRDGPCDKSCVMDQDDADVATLAMKTRISMRLDVCVQNGCTDTDMFIVALLAGDERITPQRLDQAFKDKEYESVDGLVTLDWEKFLLENWTKPKDRRKNKQLINLFSENVEQLRSQNNFIPEIDQVYIDGLAK